MSTCPICHGAGFLGSGATDINDPMFGKSVPCRCKKKELADSLAKASKFGQEQSEWSLENFPGDESAKVAAMRAIESKRGIYTFISKYGRGKTGLLVAMVNELNRLGVPSLYRSVPLMLDELRRGYNNDTYDDLLEGYMTVSVLALDEFDRYYDKGGGSDEDGSHSWAAEKIFTVIDERYSHWDSRLTLIATNKLIDKGDSPIASRLLDVKRCAIVHIDGDDLRQQKLDIASVVKLVLPVAKKEPTAEDE